MLVVMFYSFINVNLCKCTHFSSWLGDYFVHTTQGSINSVVFIGRTVKAVASGEAVVEECSIGVSTRTRYSLWVDVDTGEG